MSHQYSGHEAEFDEEFEDEKPRSGFWVTALVCVVLAATGSGAAFLWRGYGDAVFAAGPKASPAAPQAAVATATQEVLLKSLADAQQRATAVAQRNQELLQAQAVEIKRLSETVSQLATRVDGLSVRNAQAAVPLPAPKKPAPKVVAPKPSAPAPLSLAPEDKH